MSFGGRFGPGGRGRGEGGRHPGANLSAARRTGAGSSDQIPHNRLLEQALDVALRLHHLRIPRHSYAPGLPAPPACGAEFEHSIYQWLLRSGQEGPLCAGNWARFVAWCHEQQRPSLLESLETLATYLIYSAPGLSRGALGRRRSAISLGHRQAGLSTPVLNTPIHKALWTAAKPASARSASPLTAARLVRIAAKCPRDLPGLRDRALLLLAAATVRPRRSSGRATGSADPGDEAAAPVGVARLFVLALDAEHVRWVKLQFRSRTDEAVPSRAVTLTRAMTAASCPVRTLEEWLRSSDTAFGPVFRKVDRWGNVEHGRLGPDAWHRILARRTDTPRRTSAKQRAR